MAKHRAETPSALALTLRPLALAFKLQLGKVEKSEREPLHSSAYYAPKFAR